MEKYVLLSEEYLASQEDELMIVEGFNPIRILGKKTGGLVSQMLGGTSKMGTETFHNINENVDTIEQLIKDWNREHEHNPKFKGPLALDIDRAKLDMEHLLSLTYISSGSFLADVFVGNLLNYRMLIRPIRNAKIIVAGYKYYLAIIRSALQQSLVALEFSADMFFSQVAMAIMSRRKQMKELHNRIFDEAQRDLMSMLSNVRFKDDNDNKLKGLTSKEIRDIGHAYNELMKMNKQMFSQYYGNNSGMNQNIFVDSGRNIESLLRASQDKELQTLSEQLNALGTAGSLNKDKAQDAKEMAANYVQLVKTSAESRAQRVASQIHMNMIGILKMFSLRNLENYTNIFEGMDDVVEQDSIWKEKYEQSERERQDEIQRRLEKENEGIKLTEEDQKNVRKVWDAKGIGKLFGDPKKYDDMISGKLDLREYMKKDEHFTDNQITNIVDGSDKIDDYTHITLADVKTYNKYYVDDEDVEELEFPNMEKLLDLKIKSGDSDKYVGWLKTSSKEYERLEEANGDKKKKNRR